jgi:hypothetical protein
MRGILAALLLALTALGLAAGPASARTELTAIGAQGDATAKSECPAGSRLVGFSGRRGVWIDRIQIVCAPVQPDGHLGQPVATGPEFGGAGGGRVDGFCPRDSALDGVYLDLTTNNRQVASIDAKCVSVSTGEATELSFGNPTYRRQCNPHPVVGNCPVDLNTHQYCPPGEVPLGMTVRYGAAVNAFGLICGGLAAAAPPPPGPPAASQKPVHHVQRGPTGPAPVRTLAFTGVWSSRSTADNGHKYVLTLTALTPDLPPQLLPIVHFHGTLESPDDPNFNGFLDGQAPNGQQTMTFTFTQPGAGVSGQGAFTLETGDSMVGFGVVNGVRFDWNNVRGAPPPRLDRGVLHAVTVVLSVDVYGAPGGDGPTTGSLAAGTAGVQLVEACQGDWCHVRWPAGEGWVYSGPDYNSLGR